MNNAIEAVRKSIEETISEAEEAQLLLYTVEEDIQMFRKGNARLKAENAKLRDLIADMSKAFLTLDIDHCQACPMDKDNRRCKMFVAADGECAFVTEMRELGIEVAE